MPTDKHPADCLCERYACSLRRKNFSTKLDTGVSGVPGLKMTSPGQDGPAGRDEGGRML